MALLGEAQNALLVDCNVSININSLAENMWELEVVGVMVYVGLYDDLESIISCCVSCNLEIPMTNMGVGLGSQVDR